MERIARWWGYLRSRFDDANRYLWRQTAFQFLRPLGHILAYYPLLLPMPLFLWAVCWNLILTEYDGFHVIWNPDPIAGFMCGAGVAIITGGTLLSVYLLDQSQCTPSLVHWTKSDEPPPAPPVAPANIPPTPRWAYWALWVIFLLVLILPGFVSGLFFDDQPAPFLANHQVVAPGLFSFTEASHTHHESLGEFQNIRVQMKGSRYWFPCGLAATVVVFLASRWLLPEPWEDLSLLRHFAGWLLAVLIAHGLLMFLAHSLLGERAGNDDWKIAWWVRSILGTVGLFVLIAAVWWTWLSGKTKPDPSATPPTPPAPPSSQSDSSWSERAFAWVVRRLKSLRSNSTRSRTSRIAVIMIAALILVSFFLASRHGTAYCPATGAPVALLGMLSVVTGLAALVTYISHRVNWSVIPITVGAVIVPFLFSSCQTEYRVPGVGEYDTPVPLERYDDMLGSGNTPSSRWYTENNITPPKFVEDTDAIQAAAVRLKEDGRPMVVVATSGGASASALYTADILFTLEMQHPGFFEQVRIITGASGGMLGASYFVASFRDGTPLSKARQRHREKKLTDEEYRDIIRAARAKALHDLGQDFLGPIVQRWAYHDMPLYLLPRSTTNDRGLALEQGWRQMDGYSGDKDRPLAKGGILHFRFSELQEDEKAARIPSLIFAPMMIEDGRQLLISNLNLGYMVDSKIPDSDCQCLSDPSVSHTALEFYRLFPDASRAPKDGKEPFRLSTAVRMNASFPFFSPPATLPTRPRRHIVDAGYFDNYGTLTAAKWIVRNAETVDKLLKYPSDKAAEIVLLQIHCFAFESETKDWVRRDEKGGRDAKPGALHSVVAPVIGALSSRRANMVYRGDERISGVKQLLDRNGIPMFERVLIECDISPSLNWVLTPDTRRLLREDVWEQLEKNCDSEQQKHPGLGPLLTRGVRPNKEQP